MSQGRSQGYDKVTIIGTGLMGGSLGLALARLPFVDMVCGYDVKGESGSKALEIGAVDEVAGSMEEALRGCSLLFICVPVGRIVECFREALPFIETGTIVVDIGSTKSSITAAMDELCPHGVHYVGGHPMTGSERSGIEFASDSLYKESYFILTPTHETNMDAFQRLHKILSSIGARVISLDPEQHDRAMAIVSHVPHILALLLMGVTAQHAEEMQSLLNLAAGSFRDMTRIAASNPELWIDICLDNIEYIVDYLKEYAEGIAGIVRVMQEGDRERLREMFWEANRARSSIPLKPGVETYDIFELQVPVEDRPGVISAVTTEVGSLGINIEDIHIIHPVEAERGLLTLAVLGEDDVEKARARLSQLGYQASVKPM